MWPKSDERKLRKLFRSGQPETVPDTLRARLQADVNARFAQPRRVARFSGLLSRALRAKPLLAGAAALIVALLIGVLLTTPRAPNLFAEVLEAMAQVKTAHVVSTHGPQLEIWFSADHGFRAEFSGQTQVFTPEGSWDYDYTADRDRVIISEPRPDVLTEPPYMPYLINRSGARLLERLRDDPSLARSYRVSDVVVDGAAAKRIDRKPIDRLPGLRVWIDASTMRVMAHETWDIREDGSQRILERLETEYDVPIDAALFCFEPPAGATVLDCRIDSQFQEIDSMTPIEKNPNFARDLIDSMYAGSLSSLHNSLTTSLMRLMPDSVAAGTAAMLSHQFGSVKNLEFLSIRPFRDPPLCELWVETVWTVIAERASFEMKLYFDPEGKVQGIWFRGSSDQEWSPAHELGAGYLKQQRQGRAAGNNN